MEGRWREANTISHHAAVIDARVVNLDAFDVVVIRVILLEHIVSHVRDVSVDRKSALPSTLQYESQTHCPA